MSIKSVISGLLFCIIGIIFLISSLDYDIGNINNMGTGFFPGLVSLLLILCGIIIMTDKND